MAPRGQINASTTPIAAVVFDLDGTLVDSRSDIVAATNYALAKHGFEPQPSERITSFVGDGARKLLARAASLDADDTRLLSLTDSFIAYYLEHPVDGTTLMPGVRSTLDELLDLRLAICTNKPRAPTEAILRALDLASRFSVVVAGGDLRRQKPDPEALLFTAHALGVEIKQIVMVGDGPQDIACGRAAGTRTVGVRGPIVSLERLGASGPDALITSMSELAPLIRRWQNEST